jgi:hypothetical protein
MKKIGYVAFALATLMYAFGPSSAFAQTGTGKMAKCKKDIGWSSMDKRQKNSPDTIRRLEECKKNMK